MKVRRWNTSIVLGTTWAILRIRTNLVKTTGPDVYGVLIDSIINSYLIQHCGYSTSSWNQIGLVANTYCDYFGAAQYPGMLDVGLRVVRMGKSSIMYEVAVFQEGNEQVKAIGGFTQIWVDKASSKALKDGVPKEIKEPLGSLLKRSEQDPAVAKL
ncbi:hypothetical protein LTR37_006675 [Vermiconidia calcicola]|uniref:Uncharacterized protein n=1 Tax=Vermiconidia calcicola TaxID=1690605 RepID=A0ACC3NGH0_9PEZI|nr:hypothetical protein LTR37_006675 [Vermiconidia calcicola]